MSDRLDLDKLQGPEVGALCRAVSPYDWLSNKVVRVLERSYVWSPGQPSACRHYDWSVIEYGPGRKVVVNDTDLVPLVVGEVLA